MLKLFLIIAYTANLILSTESAAPLTCTENERVSNCPDGENPKIYCSQLEERAICKYPVSCRKGCVCTDGYLRNDKFVCVPINECPRSTCGENEIFSYCVHRGCENNYCSQLDQHNTLSEILFCVRGCICKDGYLRNDKGACVPISESQYTKTGKYDETTKSIKKREALTVTENMKNIKTTTTPSEHENYIAMITPFQATPTCTENEIVSHCVNGGCGKKHCSQLEEYTMCIDPLYCMKGCICKDGYLRNDQGVCVPINECPRPTCGENEIFSYCMDRGCENNYCSQLHQHNEEILHCRRGCICKDGYMLNDEEACVPISESLKF